MSRIRCLLFCVMSTNLILSASHALAGVGCSRPANRIDVSDPRYLALTTVFLEKADARKLLKMYPHITAEAVRRTREKTIRSFDYYYASSSRDRLSKFVLFYEQDGPEPRG